MIVFPAMDLMNGFVVKLESAKHKKEERIYGMPSVVADRWLGAGAEWLHVVDLDAALNTGMVNHLALLSLIPKAHKHHARIQWGGGVRDARILRLLLDAESGSGGEGIDRVIVGTRAIKDWEWLVGAAEEYPKRIVVAIDAMGRDIMVGGWQEKAGVDVVDFVQKAKELPIAAFLYTNVAVEGRGQGVQWEPVKEVVKASPKPVIFSGGISSLEDVARFKELGAYGIIVGSALYSNQIDFGKARAIAS